MAEELSENNLYVNGRIIQFADGEQILIREKIVYVGKEQDTYHTVRDFDEIGALAWRYYKKYVQDASKYWWVIADVNNIHNPFDLTEWVGKELLIPNILTIKLTIGTE